jgi:hypothetical protein
MVNSTYGPMINGIAYINISPPTDSELVSYPHVIFTSEMTWDLIVLDGEYHPVVMVIEDEELLQPAYHHNTFTELKNFHVDYHILHNFLQCRNNTYESSDDDATFVHDIDHSIDFDEYMDNCYYEVHHNCV